MRARSVIRRACGARSAASVALVGVEHGSIGLGGVVGMHSAQRMRAWSRRAGGRVGVDRGICTGRTVAGESRGSKSTARPRRQELGASGGSPRRRLSGHAVGVPEERVSVGRS